MHLNATMLKIRGYDTVERGRGQGSFANEVPPTCECVTLCPGVGRGAARRELNERTIEAQRAKQAGVRDEMKSEIHNS